MNFFYKTLFSKLLNYGCLNNVNQRKLCRLRYFSSSNYYFFGSIYKPLQILNKNNIYFFSNVRNFSLSFDFNISIKIKRFLYKLFLIEKVNHSKLALKWYKTLQKINYSEFFTLLEIPDTFSSWFRVTELHIWMLLVRLQQDKNCPTAIRTNLMEMMWSDAELRARIHVPHNVKFKKNFKQFYEEFRFSLFTYDEAFLSDDKALASGLWCCFFKKNCDDPKKLEALVSFVRCQINHLQLFNFEDVNKEEVSEKLWKSLKDHLKN